MNCSNNDDSEKQKKQDVNIEEIFKRNPPSIGWILFDIIFWFIILLFNLVFLSFALSDSCYSSNAIYLILTSILLCVLAIFVAVLQWIGYSIYFPFMVGFRMLRVLITTLLYYTLFAEVYLVSSQHTLWNI